MKQILVVLLLLPILFMIYVVIVNRHSKSLTLRQKLLKSVYPALMLFSKRQGTSAPAGTNPTVPFYSLTARAIDGTEFRFNQLKGKKVLLVNTASDCGYTAQYAELEKLQQKFPNELLVLGFPSNDFNEQEKADNANIAAFCKRNFGVSFPLMHKSTVKHSAQQSPVYKWLTDPALNGWNSKPPEWNFTKYMVDEEGRLVQYFPPTVSPLDQTIVKLIR